MRTVDPTRVSWHVARLCAAIMAGVVLVTCTDGPTASRASARLTIAPQFNASASVAGGALGVDHVRVQVIQSDEDVLVDRTYAFPSTGASLSIDLTIPLSQPQDSVSIVLDYLHGTEVLYSGSAAVVLQAGVAAEPVTIPVSYGGPGQKATSLTIAPRDTQLTSGDQMQFRVTALSGAVPDSVYVGWWTSNGAQAIDVNGHLTGTLTRGVVTVYAQSSTPPGLEDSTTVRIVPKPAAMVKVGGDAQTGSAGAPLPLPLVVQVNGSDQLGVSGVTVTFAAVTGGSVSASSVVTDSTGRASTTATLGSASGTQTFSANAGSLSVTFSEAASGTAPVKTWTGAVSTDWNTAGNWNPSAVPGTSDSVTIPSGATRQPTLHTGAYTVGGMSIQSGAIVTMDTAVLNVLGDFGNAGAIADPFAVSNITLAGTSRRTSGSLQATSVTVAGTYTLTGTTQATNLVVTGSLTFNGHRATVASSFETAGTGVIVMATAADTLQVLGSVLFEGGNTSGDLTAGTLLVAGSVFVQSGTRSFIAGPGHTTVFNGTVAQTIAFTDSTTSAFGSVTFSNTTSVSLASIAQVQGNVVLTANANVTAIDTTFTGWGMTVAGNVTTAAGSVLRLGRLYLSGVLSVGGTYATTAIIFTGGGQTIPAGLPYHFVYVGGGSVTVGAGTQTIANQLAVQGGTLTLSANLTVPGNTFTQYGGTLILNGHVLTTVNFTANNGGFLKMTNPADTLTVAGNLAMGGGNSNGLLTAGGILLLGNLTQSGDPQAFAPSGTSGLALIGSGTQTVTFANPGASGLSHFNNLLVINTAGAVTLGSAVWILGQQAIASGVAHIIHGSGQALHLANMMISNFTFDNVALAYDASLGGGNLVSLDSITFTNYNVNSATPLITIVSPGNAAGGAFQFVGLNFGTVIGSGSGVYVSATDSNTGDGNVLAIQLTSNLAVAEGNAHTTKVGGATVTWQ